MAPEWARPANDGRSPRSPAPTLGSRRWCRPERPSTSGALKSPTAEPRQLHEAQRAAAGPGPAPIRCGPTPSWCPTADRRRSAGGWCDRSWLSLFRMRRFESLPRRDAIAGEAGQSRETTRSPGVPRQHVEIAVVVKHCRAGADCYRADEAVDQPANGLSPAAAGTIQGGRLVIVGGSGRKKERALRLRRSSPRPISVTRERSDACPLHASQPEPAHGPRASFLR